MSLRLLDHLIAALSSAHLAELKIKIKIKKGKRLNSTRFCERLYEATLAELWRCWRRRGRPQSSRRRRIRQTSNEKVVCFRCAGQKMLARQNCSPLSDSREFPTIYLCSRVCSRRAALASSVERRLACASKARAKRVTRAKLFSRPTRRAKKSAHAH